MMLAWILWLPRPILSLAESAYGDDGAPAAMMLAQQIDMQWYCVEQALSFNDLSTVIANGDYLHDKLCFIPYSVLSTVIVYPFPNRKMNGKIAA
jgi:hypothetical protein